MNANDFVILPGSKTGLSVKLKAKSIRELQLEKMQLELENKEMENKVQQLQGNMSRAKQEREGASGYHWKSGQAGPSLFPQLLSQNKENIGKVSSGKVKLKVLKEQDHINVTSETTKQAVSHKVIPDTPAEKPKVKGKACGQCEMKSAFLMCLECGEYYCPGCFAKMHQKGALKLHRTTSLQSKTQVPIGKLEAAQQFLKAVNSEESKDTINKEQKKDDNDKLKERFLLSLAPLCNLKEASTAPSPEVGLESQTGGALLQGSFDEEVSAKYFQDALNQWRRENCSPKFKEERSCQVGSVTEHSDLCHVQTSPPLVKKPLEIEFKEDSLTYMERLLIRKHRRTPIDKLPDSILEDELKLEKSLINETENRDEKEEEEEEEDDIAVIRLEAEEMKKYWTDAFKKEPEVTKNSEPSLEIKILEDTFKELSEESAISVSMETEEDELVDYRESMSKNKNTEPDISLAQAGNITTRSPLSSAVGSEMCLTFLRNKPGETPKVRAPFSQSEGTIAACSCSGAVEMVPNDQRKRVIAKEKCPQTKKSNSHMSREQTHSHPGLVPGKPFAVTDLPKDCKKSLEFNEASPPITKASAVALREKAFCNTYRGLEGFFTMDTPCQHAAVGSPSRARQSPSNIISFSGSELWAKHSSLSVCADDCVVQDVLEKMLRRPSSSLERITPNPESLLSDMSREIAFPRHLSVDVSLCNAIKRSPSVSVLETEPTNSAARPLSGAASEISEIEGIDVTEHNDPFWECSADQQALKDLEDELQSDADPREHLGGIISGGFSRLSKTTWQNLSDVHNNNEIHDCSKGDIIRVYESHTDDEEDQKDRQQVLELH